MRYLLYILVLVSTITSCHNPETLTEDRNKKESDNAGKSYTRLIKTAEHAVLDMMPDKLNHSLNLETKVISIKGREIPFVTLKGQNVIYPIIIDSNLKVLAILKQVTIYLPNGSIKESHYLNGMFVGCYLKNKEGVLLKRKGKTHHETPNESCAGRWYRKMKEAIASDGDTEFLCEVSGPACDAAIYTAAIIHCLKQ